MPTGSPTVPPTAVPTSWPTPVPSFTLNPTTAGTVSWEQIGETRVDSRGNAEYHLLTYSANRIRFQFTAFAAAYGPDDGTPLSSTWMTGILPATDDCPGSGDQVFSIDLVLVSAATGDMVDVVEQGLGMATPYYNASYTAGTYTSVDDGEWLSWNGGHELRVTDYNCDVSSTSPYITVSSTQYPTGAPTSLPSGYPSPAPSQVPSSTPTSAPTTETLHIELTNTANNHTLSFGTGDFLPFDGADEIVMNLGVKFTGLDDESATVTVRLCEGVSTDDDECPTVVKTLAVGITATVDRSTVSVSIPKTVNGENLDGSDFFIYTLVMYADRRLSNDRRLSLETSYVTGTFSIAAFSPTMAPTTVPRRADTYGSSTPRKKPSTKIRSAETTRADVRASLRYRRRTRRPRRRSCRQRPRRTARRSSRRLDRRRRRRPSRRSTRPSYRTPSRNLVRRCWRCDVLQEDETRSPTRPK